MGTSRRTFLGTMAGAATFLPRERALAEKKDAPPLLSFAVMADAQYVDGDTKGSRHYRESVGKLETSVGKLNDRSDLAFGVHLGDLIDRDFKSFDDVMPVFEKSKLKFHQLLGNHDFDLAAADKAKVPERMGMAKRYHDFAHKGCRFVVLDGTDLSTYAHGATAKETVAAAELLKKVRGAKKSQAHDWNAGMGNTQLAWLDGTLKKAQAASERVFLLCHYPVFPANAHNLWNDDAVLKTIAKYPCVAAWFNGHNHAGNYGESKGVHFITFHGMVETASTNAFATVEVFEDRFEIDGFGREKDRVLRLGT